MYRPEELKILYERHDLETFLKEIDIERIADPRMRSIISTLHRSIQNLRLEFNPVEIKAFSNKFEESNKPHEQ